MSEEFEKFVKNKKWFCVREGENKINIEFNEKKFCRLMLSLKEYHDAINFDIGLLDFELVRLKKRIETMEKEILKEKVENE